MKPTEWDEEKLEKLLERLAEHLPELERANQQVLEAIEYAKMREEKWERRLAEKRAKQQQV